MLRELDVYDIVNRNEVPKGVRILPTKMDLKTKYLASGEIDKLKARLVVLGMLEQQQVEEENFSPTADHKTVNLLFSLAAQHGLQIKGLDIFGAFLTADMKGTGTDVYIQLPEGLVPNAADGKPPVWKLKRTLYGLRRCVTCSISKRTLHSTAAERIHEIEVRRVSVLQDQLGR